MKSDTRTRKVRNGLKVPALTEKKATDEKPQAVSSLVEEVSFLYLHQLAGEPSGTADGALCMAGVQQRGVPCSVDGGGLEQVGKPRLGMPLCFLVLAFQGDCAEHSRERDLGRRKVTAETRWGHLVPVYEFRETSDQFIKPSLDPSCMLD